MPGTYFESTAVSSQASVIVSTQPVRTISGSESYAAAKTSVSLAVQPSMDHAELSVQTGNWQANVAEKVQSYLGLEDGWKGDGTIAPSQAVVVDALDVVYQFATEMPDLASPMVSADEDGAIIFYWKNDPLVASVSVYGDGTYAYYAEGYDEPVRSDGDEIGVPLPASLITTMTGVVVSGSIAA